MAGTILFGLCVVVLTGFSFYVSTNHARKWIEARLNGTIAGSIAFESMGLSLWRGRGELRNVVLKGTSQEAIAGFERLVFDLDWMKSLGGDLTVKSLLLEKPWTKIRATEEGGNNLLEATAAPTAPEQLKKEQPKKEDPGQQSRQGMPFNLVVQSLEILGGHGVYEDLSAKLAVAMEDIRIRANGNVGKKSGTLDLRVADLSLQQGERDSRFQELTVQGRLEEERIAPFQIHMAMGASTLNVSGSVGDAFEKPNFDVVAHLAASLADLKEHFHVEPTLAGSATAELALRGSTDDPQMTLMLDCREGLLGPYRANRLTLDCTLKDRLFVLKGLWDNAAAGNIQVSGEADLGDAFPKGLLGNQRDWEAIPYRLSLAAKAVQPSGLFPGAAKVTGVVDATVAVEGRGFAPGAVSAKSMLKAAVRNLSLQPGHHAVDWQVGAEANLRDNTVTVERLAVEGDNVTMAATGTFDLVSERIAGQLRLDTPDLRSALWSFGVTDASGRVVLEADVSGPLAMPQARFVFDGEAMHFRDYFFGDLHVDGMLDETGTLRLAEWSLKNQGSVIEGNGHVGIFKKPRVVNPVLPVKLSLAMRHVEITDFVKENLAKGVLDGEVHVAGSIKAPEATAHVRGKAVAIQALRLGDMDAKLELAKGTLRIHQLALHNANSAVRVAGDIGLFHEGDFQVVRDPVFQLKIQEGRIALRDFHDTSRGNLTIAGHLTGRLSKPEGTVSLEGTTLDFGVQKLDRLRLLARLDGDRLWIEPFQLVVAPGETIEGQGWISLDKHFDLKLVSVGVSLEHIDFVQKTAAVKGSLQSNLAVTGSWQDPQLYGEIAVQGLWMWGQPMEDVAVSVGIEDQLARISAKHPFDLEGTYHLAKRDFSVSLQLEETDLEPYFRLASLVDFSGIATGRIEAHGNLEAVDGLQASLDISRLSLSWQGRNLVHTENLKALVKDQQLSLPSVNLAVGSDGHLQLHGTARRNGPVTIQLHGEIPLKALAPFIEALPDLDGRLVLSARADGSQAQPQISGELTMKDVGVTLPGLLQRLEGLEGRVRVDSHQVVIDRVRGKLDGGPFVLTGKIGAEGFRPTTIQVELKADTVPVRLPDTLDLLLSTELNIEGTRQQAAVQGDVVVLEGTYFKDVRLSFLPEQTGKTRRDMPSAEKVHPFIRNTSVDISVKRRGDLIVDNNLAYLELNPDLRIVGRLENPVIRGRATVESGTLRYRRKAFEIKKGFVDFSNPYKTEGYIDMVGEIKIRHWDIVLAVSGTQDALSFKLTSVPPEEDEDILSLLLTGRTTGELIEGEGGAGKSSAQMLAEAMAGVLSDDIKDATGLDTLEVEVGTEKGQDAFSVTMGKDLSRRMSVKSVVESKEGNIIERAIAEYKFFEHVLFSGSQDTEGVFGGEVKYRLEFR